MFHFAHVVILRVVVVDIAQQSDVVTFVSTASGKQERSQQDVKHFEFF
jgi:hypothetical protein